MDRRSFLKLSTFGSAAALVAPSLLVGCSSPPRASGVAPFDGEALRVRRFSDAQGNLFELYAMEGRARFFRPDGSLRAELSELRAPVSLTADARGRIVIVESGRKQLSVFDLDGKMVAVVDAGAPLAGPRDVAFAGSRLAVADTLNHRVRILDANSLTPVGTIGDASILNGPVSVAFGPDGALYVADIGHSRVQVFALDGRRLDSLGGYGTEPGQLNQPRCVRVDGGGNLHVADAVGGYVSVFDETRRFAKRFRPTLASGQPGTPLWLSEQPDGSLLVGSMRGAPVEPTRAAA